MQHYVYACGFNGLQQLDNSDHAIKFSWVKLPDQLHDDQCVSVSWDALYIYTAEGQMKRNGRPIQPFAPYEKDKPIMLSAAEDRLIALHKDGSVMLLTDSWRRLQLQCSAEKSPGRVCHVGVGRQTLAACDSEGVLWTLDAVPSPAGEFVTAVTCGREHVVLLTRSGRVYTYGGGSRGQLGTGDLTAAEVPQLVDTLDGVHIQQVSAGGWHTAVVSRDGDVYAWGWNESGQLGVATDEVGVSAEPRLVEALSTDVTVRQVACGTRHTLALLDDGSVFGWGGNGYGQLATARTGGATPPHQLATPPDQLATPPDQLATPPDQLATPPDQLVTPPDQLATPPDQLATPPDQLATPPDQLATPPDQLATPPDQLATPPDQLATPPGRVATPPDQLATPPDQLATPPDQLATPPGRVATPPCQLSTPPGRVVRVTAGGWCSVLVVASPAH